MTVEPAAALNLGPVAADPPPNYDDLLEQGWNAVAARMEHHAANGYAGDWLDAQYDEPTQRSGPTCPTCESPDPRMHPATQAEGEVVSICADPLHAATTKGER